MNWKGYFYALWSARLLLIIILVYIIFGLEAQNSIILFVFLLASLLPVVIPFLLRKKLPHLPDLLVVTAALINAVAWTLGNLGVLFFYDEIAHFYTTFAISLFIGIYLSQTDAGRVLSKHNLFFAVSIASFGVTIGVFWEIFEWIYSFFLEEPVIGNLFDTITDLIFDTIGAAFSAFFILYIIKGQRQLDELS